MCGMQTYRYVFASIQLETVHDDATEEVGAALETDAHFGHVGDCRLQREHLLGIDVVRIEWLAVQRLAGRVLHRHGTVFAGESTLELNGDGADGGGRIQTQRNVLGCALPKKKADWTSTSIVMTDVFPALLQSLNSKRYRHSHRKGTFCHAAGCLGLRRSLR